jgi:predicted TPR repeat methyltransferase
VDEAARLSDEGYALLEAGRYAEAHALLARARLLAPQDALIHYRLGLLYGDTGHAIEALAAYDAALERAPGHARAHNNRGSVLQRLGRDAEAEAAFRHAMQVDPLLAQPYLNLGHLIEARDPEAAVSLYERAIAQGLDRGVFGHHIAAVRGRTTPRAEPAWVRATFDNFAPLFDSQLATLGYDAPDRLVAMLGRVDRSLDILDLGCGTGLVGAALAGRGHRIVGVDLAEKMLIRARARGVYARLENAEIHVWLAAASAATFDIVVAADVFIYIGALEEAFAGVARVLRPGGRFAFSTEESATGHELRPSGRYAQAQAYVAQCAEPFFATVAAPAVVLRQEAGTPLDGRLYLLERLAMAT